MPLNSTLKNDYDGKFYIIHTLLNTINYHESFHVNQQINFKHYIDVKYAPLKRKNPIPTKACFE